MFENRYLPEGPTRTCISKLRIIGPALTRHLCFQHICGTIGTFKYVWLILITLSELPVNKLILFYLNCSHTIFCNFR
jgi:hypothetical protein